MTRIAQQVSRAIRILRGNRDESARASHLVVEKDLLMTYERALLGQAEREKFFQSTFFERKTMSTKTAFKRVALVAAAALAIGGITAVSAQATVGLSISTGFAGAGSITGTAIAGPANSTSVTADATHREYVVITGGTFVGGTTSQILNANASIGVNTPAVGTITIAGYEETSTTPNGIFATTVTTTVTVTVSAFAAGTLYGTSGVYLNSGTTHSAVSTTLATSTNTTAANNDAAVVTAGVTAAMGTANVANFQVIEADPNGIPLTTGFVPVTATVTNGLLTASSVTASAVGTIPTSASTYLAGTPAAGVFAFTLSSLAGISGTSTVTISVNGVVVRTFAATFTGSAAKIVLTAVNSVIGVTGAAATVTANTTALKVQEFDANGNALAVPALSLTSGTTAAIASITSPVTLVNSGTLADGSTGSASNVGITLVGAAVGTSSLTVSDGTLTSNAVSVRVSSALPTTVVVTSDLAAYPAGGAGTLTYTLSDAVGTVPAGTYTVYTTPPSSSYALTVGTANLPGTTVTVNDAGVDTIAFNAPLSDGTTTIAGTPATGITETPVSFTVSSGASDAANAATDAANEATDAANAATDAANAAADSADAATQAAEDAGAKADAALAAVTALSQQVTSVLAKVAALSALLVRVVKKVKA